MKVTKNILCALVLGLAVMLTACRKEPVKKAPNVVYVFPDQFRKHAMSFWSAPQFEGAIRTGGDPVLTPQLDKFANEAVVLTNMVSNAPICSPHRGMLFTGQFPGKSGVALNCNSSRPVSSLREDAICISDVLDQKGYDLAYFGKWHLDFPTPNDPANPGNYVDPRRPAWDAYTPAEQRHGFDYWYSYGTWDVHKDPHYYNNEGKRFEPKEYSAKHEADEVISYLKNERGQRNTDNPFAIFVSMNPPHNPYNSLEDCMEEDFNLYKAKTTAELLTRENADLNMSKAQSAPYYFANVTGVDREFGRIIEQLKAMGEYENTIIVFTSDHGETMTSQGVKDAKNSIYTEAFEVPFLIRGPGLAKHRLDNLLMGSPDIMPTLLGLMGFEESIPQEVQGFNYADALLGDKEAARPQSALYIRNASGDKDENGQVISYFPIARGIKTHHYTLELAINKNYELVGTKFFDDDADPYQLNNMSVDKNDPRVRELLAEMAFWLKHSEDPWSEKRVLSDWITY